jgi:hypothetical protein
MLVQSDNNMEEKINHEAELNDLIGSSDGRDESSSNKSSSSGSSIDQYSPREEMIMPHSQLSN